MLKQRLKRLYWNVRSLRKIDNSKFPTPYSSIKVLPYDDPGLFFNAEALRTLIKRHKVKTVVEVGSFVGKSTCCIAAALPKDGKLYAVDHWLGSPENQKGERCYHPVVDHLYEQFLSNVMHRGLQNKIVPVRMSSLEAAKVLNVRPDLIYIDAAHETEPCLADLRAWWPLVKGHGILCGDDWREWPSVRVAVEQFAREEGLDIEASGNFYRLIE